MITCISKGGLGNQLFQYAAAKSLALHHQTDFKIYNREYDIDTKRSFLLDKIFGPESFVTTNELPTFSSARKLASKLQVWNKRHYVKEKQGASKDDFFSIPKDAVIDGYWQNHQFISAEVQKDLKEEIGPIILKPKNMVAVHLRGGDYFSNSAIQKHHGNLTEDYYKKAIHEITKAIPNAEFHLFSDEPRAFEWEFLIKENIMWMSQGDTLKDFHSLKSYQNYIIANSSFSWWAAYLAMNSESQIIAPSNWFQDEKLKEFNPTMPQWKKM